MTLLYAIGVGVLANVAVAVVGRLLRLANVGLDPSGEWLVVGVAAAVIVAARGIGARRELVRLALLGLAAHAALVINRVLGVALAGRTPGDGSVDAFQFTPLALSFLIGGLVLGIAAGLIVRGFQLRIPWRPPERLVLAAGIAFVASTIAGIVWPAPVLAQLLGDTDLVTAVTSLPLILAGPLAGGAYASRLGVDYRGVALLGTYMTLPIIVTLLAGTIAGVGRLADPRFDSVAGILRGTIVLSWFLVALRLAGWPLGAAFAQGFLAPESSARTEPSQRTEQARSLDDTSTSV
ncbi:MAG TPA: hypothetical protein VMQ78_02840 [Candidatus Limnocylindria bacterium]|nr:hypothetical protein [Candidatus Limnocylindria bacterium]